MVHPSRFAGLLLLAPLLIATNRSASAETGDGASALPAIGRLDVASRLARGVALATSAGYGYTESVLGAADRHHRLGGTLAASVVPVEWLALGGRLDGRYDWHSTADGRDDGWIGEPHVLVRAGGQLGALGLAGQASLWVPGRDAPSVALAATSFDLRALASLRPAGSPVLLAATLGVRLDRSARSVTDPERMSDADRLALGVGEGPSLLTGLGMTAAVGRRLELLGEVTWDVALDDFPGPLESPLRFGAGARWSATDTLGLQALVEVVASGRPAVEAGGPLAPIEPRASVTLTAILRSASASDRRAGPRGPVTVRPAAAPPAVVPPAAEAARTGALRGRALDPDGTALAGARIRVTIGAAPPAEVVADEEGRFEATGLTEGDGTLRVSADGHDDTERPVRIAADAAAEVEVRLPRSLPRGQLRGSVTSIQGVALAATIVVQPLGTQVACGAEGSFQVDVAPGTYTVEVTAPGFRPQQRRVVIEDNGVTILNVDLRPRR